MAKNLDLNPTSTTFLVFLHLPFLVYSQHYSVPWEADLYVLCHLGSPNLWFPVQFNQWNGRCWQKIKGWEKWEIRILISSLRSCQAVVLAMATFLCLLWPSLPCVQLSPGFSYINLSSCPFKIRDDNDFLLGSLWSITIFVPLILPLVKYSVLFWTCLPLWLF